MNAEGAPRHIRREQATEGTEHPSLKQQLESFLQGFRGRQYLKRLKGEGKDVNEQPDAGHPVEES